MWRWVQRENSDLNVVSIVYVSQHAEHPLSVIELDKVYGEQNDYQVLPDHYVPEVGAAWDLLGKQLPQGSAVESVTTPPVERE